jgi:digeranylgeranylglycerophospholipid reductase
LYNTIIIGAGPVGSYLAGKLGRLGYRVLVLDKKSAAGQDVCCTGIISKECLKLLPEEISLVKRPASSVRFVAPSGKSIILSRNDEVAYVVDRVALEQVLAQRAEAAGVRYIFEGEVIDIANTQQSMRVTADYSGEEIVFDADTVVIATGFGSPLPASLGLGEIKSYVIGSQAEVEISDVNQTEIYFDRNLCPGGFSWLVPVGDMKALAGQLTYSHPKRHFKKLLATLRARGKIFSSEVTPAYRPIPLRPLPRTYSERLLVVGEAAGQVKPTTGGGIYYGLICADIAAETLHETFQSGDFSESRLATYQKKWHARLNKELKAGYWANRLFRMLGNSQIEGIYSYISRNGMPQFIAGMDDFTFDWHSQLIRKTLKHMAAVAPLLTIRSLTKSIGTNRMAK